MKLAARLALLPLLLTACAFQQGVCPETGRDTARRCRRLCVEGKNEYGPPLPCECYAECLCWQFAGHPRPSESPKSMSRGRS